MLKRFWNCIMTFVRCVIEDNLGLYAAQASFFIVFSVTPFIMLLITLAKYVLPINLEQIVTQLYRHIPMEIASFLSNLLVEVFNTSIGLISATAVSTLWLASKGVMALYLGLNNVFKPQKPHGYIRVRVMSVGYTLLFVVSMVLTIAVFGFGEYIMEQLHGTIIYPIITRIFEFRVLVFMAILTLIFAVFYKFLPQINNNFRRQLPGAALAALGWIGFSAIYAVYIEKISNYSYVYGSLTAVIFLMLWLYVCMTIFLYGAEFNKLCEKGVFYLK